MSLIIEGVMTPLSKAASASGQEVKTIEGKGFLERMESIRQQDGVSVLGEVSKSQDSFTQDAVKFLEGFNSKWQSSEKQIQGLALQMPENIRPYFQLQFLVNDLNLKSQLISKIADTGSGMLKRLQQMGTGS